MKSDSLSTRSERPQGPLTDLERSEFYLREGERLAHLGSWSLRADGIFDYWSPETFVNFGFDRWSQPLAVAMFTFDFMKQLFVFVTLTPASDGSAYSR